MKYTIAVCTAKNSWWWTEELSETYRDSFQEYVWEISPSSWFYYKKFVTMHGHVKVKVRAKIIFPVFLQRTFSVMWLIYINP